MTNFNEAGLPEALKLAQELRAAGLCAEWYPEAVKLDKQLKYADATGVRFAAIVGPDEAARGVIAVKDLQARTQQFTPRADLSALVSMIRGQ